MSNKNLYIKTPLLHSHELTVINSSSEHKTNVFLKLENCQPSGSFKMRGISHMISKSYENGAKQVISSSGGNAGLAAAYSALNLNMKCTVFVPSTVNKTTIEKLRSYNSEVIVSGSVWDETDIEARRVCSSLSSAIYIPPFDHQLIWDGNSSLIDEIKEQLGDIIPDCIIASVGGGGLMCGLIEGLIRNKWIDNKNLKLVAVETEGANCFNESIKQNRLVTLDSITSIAKTLGAKKCTQKLIDYYNQYKDKIISLVLPDSESVKGCLNLLNDHRILVEPSCGVSVAVAYNLEHYLNEKFNNVVVIVCGGTGTKLDTLIEYKNMFNL